MIYAHRSHPGRTTFYVTFVSDHGAAIPIPGTGKSDAVRNRDGEIARLKRNWERLREYLEKMESVLSPNSEDLGFYCALVELRKIEVERE